LRRERRALWLIVLAAAVVVPALVASACGGSPEGDSSSGPEPASGLESPGVASPGDEGSDGDAGATDPGSGSEGGNLSGRVDGSAPAESHKLVFVHHSCGENWLADENGGLGRALADAGYYVSDTNYGWGPAVADGTPIGDLTDIGHWYLWFRDPQSSPATLAALYAESGQHSSYTRASGDPGGPNEIVMIKSCYPNSNLGSPTEPVPAGDENPLRGRSSDDGSHTVANAKGIYTDVLEYFREHPETLFVVVTAPPVGDPSSAANARGFNDWLVRDWLAGYEGVNVVVWDFYNVLTGADAHHRVADGRVEHVRGGSDTAAYAQDGDDHPSAAGNRKATDEFVPFLNAAVHRWEEKR